MIVRDEFISPAESSGNGNGDGDTRLNLLLCFAPRWHDSNVDHLLPPLLQPVGIGCLNAESVEEATDLIRARHIHIAIVDLAVPLHRGKTTGPAGPRVLQMLRRLDQPPPTVLVRPPQASQRENVRGLSDALREGAFAVLDRPVHWETMLETLRRLVRRHYAGLWPES